MREKTQTMTNHRGLFLIKSFVSKYEMSALHRGFMRWKRFNLKMIKLKRHKAATKIQVNVKIWQSRKLIDQIRNAKTHLYDVSRLFAIRICEWERVARKQKNSRMFELNLDLVRLRNIKVLRKSALKMQQVYRGRLGRKDFLDHKNLVSKALMVQCAWRSKQGRFSLHLKKVAYAQRQEDERIASIDIQRIRRSQLARRVRASKQAELDAFHAKLDHIQDTWKRLRRTYFKKCNHASAMMDADEESRDRWLALLAKQKAAATICQTCMRAWYARVTYKVRRFAWNTSASMLQRTWRKVLEARSHTDEYKERRAALRLKAIDAQNLLIPWVNLYPELVLKDVGHLLKKDPSQVGYYEINLLEKAEVKWASFHVTTLASLEVQRVFRGYLGKCKRSQAFTRRIILLQKRHNWASVICQKIYRGHQGRRWSKSFDLQQQTRELLKELPAKLDIKFGVRSIISKRYQQLWYDQQNVLDKALKWGRQHIIETASAGLFQRIYRGHQGKLAYLARLAIFNKDSQDALEYTSCRCIQCIWRGVFSRRTRDAIGVIKRIWALDHKRYPQILTRKMREIVNLPPTRLSFVQIARLHSVADEWVLYTRMYVFILSI